MSQELYDIVRYFKDEKYKTKIIRRGVTLKEAQDHCNDPETCSKTCTTSAGKQRTMVYGEWFDGYVRK